MSIYLGLDCSTQGLSATVIEIAPSSTRVVFARAYRFDDLLPAYGTRHGVLPSPAPGVVHAPPSMWAEALDTVFGILVREARIDWTALRAISGSAQQHGTVYLNSDAARRLDALAPDRPLAGQVSGVLARPTSPVWMDTSTAVECEEIESALGGPGAAALLTGSRCFERFSAAQIRRFAKQDPGAYASTSTIHLVSSWLASLLAGRHAPIDHADGSGMNLMTLSTREWSDAAIDATAPGLASKLPPLAAPWTIVGTLHPFWIERHGLPAARVAVWSGDNPCSLVGTGLVRPGTIAVSLGTSDTVFGAIEHPRPAADGTGHVFASPAGGYMGMTVFRNGSLARERIRDAYGLDWTGFGAALRATPPGNGGAMMVPWFEPEITPVVGVPGVSRDALDAGDGPANVRALVEGQMMTLALHTRWMGDPPAALHATGGASAGRDILQVMADVFDATVVALPSRNSAALGAALRAWYADAAADGRPVAWPDVVRGFTEPVRRIDPVPAHVRVYRELLPRYAELQRRHRSAGSSAARPV